MIRVIDSDAHCSWYPLGSFQWAGGMYARWVIPASSLRAISRVDPSLKAMDDIVTSKAYHAFDDSHDCTHTKFTTAFPVHSGRGMATIDTDEVPVSAFVTREGSSTFWNIPPYSVWVGVTNTNYLGQQMYVKQGYCVTEASQHVYLVDRVIKTGFITSAPFTCSVSTSRQIVYWTDAGPHGPGVERIVVATGSKTVTGSAAILLMLQKYQQTFQALGTDVDYSTELEIAKSNAASEIHVPMAGGITFAILPPTPEQLTSLRRLCAHYKELYFGDLTYARPRRREFGVAVQKALDDVKYVDINTIAYLKEAVEAVASGAPIAELPAIADFSRDPSLGGLASILLSYSYGTKLTVADSVEIKEGVKKLKHRLEFIRRDLSTVKGWASTRFPNNYLNISRKITANVIYHQQQSEIRRLWSTLNEMDLEPSMSNLWDLIPYSFVIDWFSNVGDILKSIDTLHESVNLDLAYYIRSYKDSGYLDTDIRRYGVDRIIFSHYVREVRSTLDIPCPDLDIHPAGVSVAPQGIALIVQRLA